MIARTRQTSICNTTSPWRTSYTSPHQVRVNYLGPILIVLYLVCTPGWVMAGPSIIRDIRIQDKATTPFLGRGYSLATNSFASSCLGTVKLTTPTYDFQFFFSEASIDDQESMAEIQNILLPQAAAKVMSTLTDDVENEFRAGLQSQHLVTSLGVFQYYGSVDEASSSLAPQALAILKGNDIPGFFAACSTYYIRGMTRRSEFTSTFSATTTEQEEASTMFQGLTQEIMSFQGDAFQDTDTDSNMMFQFQAQKMQLRIDSTGYGLSKQAGANLITFDIASYKEAVRVAFTSMQDPLVGEVQSIEVVPWVDNLQFQEAVNMTGFDTLDGKTEVPLYKKKMILSRNGEFLSEMWAAGRAKIEKYYTSQLCASNLRAKYYTSGNIPATLENVKMLNNRTLQSSSQVTLSSLDKALKELGPKYLENYNNFMYNETADANDGSLEARFNPTAQACADRMLNPPSVAVIQSEIQASELESLGKGSEYVRRLREAAEAEGRGLLTISWDEHEVCRGVHGKLEPEILSPIIDQFCMPRTTIEDPMNAGDISKVRFHAKKQD